MQAGRHHAVRMRPTTLILLGPCVHCQTARQFRGKGECTSRKRAVRASPAIPDRQGTVPAFKVCLLRSWHCFAYSRFAYFRHVRPRADAVQSPRSGCCRNPRSSSRPPPSIPGSRPSNRFRSPSAWSNNSCAPFRSSVMVTTAACRGRGRRHRWPEAWCSPCAARSACRCRAHRSTSDSWCPSRPRADAAPGRRRLPASPNVRR